MRWFNAIIDIEDNCMDNLINRVTETVNKYKMIGCGEGIVVGISGGPDSVCLLHVLNNLRQRFSIKLYAVHINHMLRGYEAEGDAAYVKQLCDGLGVKLFAKSIDIKAVSKQNGISLESAGREERYKFFFEVLNNTGSSKIAVAHNMNDQAETVLMHFIRGSGLEGLSGMKPMREDGVIRPLIEIERADIEKYCMENDLKPRLDKSNLETTFTRNRIRLELIPCILKEHNPNLIKTLAVMADNNRSDNDYIDSMVNEALDKMINVEIDSISLPIDWLLSQHLSKQNRIIRRAIERLLGSIVDIENKHIAEIKKIIVKGNTGLKIDLPRGIVAEIVYKTLYIKKKQGSSITYEYPLVLNQKIYINELNICIYAYKIHANELQSIEIKRNTAVFDSDKLKKSICVRSRIPGDIITPLGMTGTKKVKDFFIDLKIPRREREKVPLLAMKDEIIWILGHRINNKYKCTPSTQEILVVTYSQGGKIVD
jgi:tRNA(Ile)-lysidine synthase